MAKTELCYQIETIPDLSLNKYSSLDGSGVEGVLEKHLAFLRQWNRKGVLSGTSIHLFYCYDGRNPERGYGGGEKGNKLKILFLIRGEEEKMKNVPELVSSSMLSGYFHFSACNYREFLRTCHFEETTFSFCSTLMKKEVFIKSSLETSGKEDEYYTVPQWEINEEGRLYHMVKLMESLDRQLMYRVDLYPAERSSALREALRKPMSVLRERQYSRAGMLGQRDFEAENVLRGYDDTLARIDASPHFIANLFVFADDAENSAVVLDAAGAEALKKGSYNIGSFGGRFAPDAFLDSSGEVEYYDRRKKVILQKGAPGLIACLEEAQNYKLRYLPTLFTVEEAAPFFRFPALYEGEVIQKPKETAPRAVSAEGGLYLGTDDNGYDVYFPLKNLAKHAFIAGVPGSGKTNTMHHLTSTLWKKHRIPFLVLEPAKQEYRALANQPGMEDLYLFSPNADMLFPLHINPFEFPKGLMLAEHIRRLGSVFEGAFPLDNPMPFLLDTAIEAVYRDLGWTPETVYTDETTLQLPTMSMLYKRLEDELKTTRYSEEVRGNLESALKVRIGSLLRREMGDVFDVPMSTIPPEEWLRIPAVIELESMGTGPANFLTLMLCALIREALKVNPHHDRDHARHVIFIEEAHNLIGPEAEETFGAEANPKQAATAFVVKMLAEVRALKEGIVIADQLPTVMAQEVIKNTGLKIGLRITSSDDRALLGSTMAANGLQVEEMATFNVGRSLISYEGLMRPFTMQTHEWCGSWATPRCGEDRLDQEGCKTCPYFESGDCIPDRRERERITVSKPDGELAALMRDRAPYIKICERSFVIEGTRFSRELTKLSRRVSLTLDHLKRLNEKDIQIKKLEDRIVEMAGELSRLPDGELSREKVGVIQEEADRVNRLKIQLDSDYLSSPKFKGVYGMIVDCIALARSIQDRKKHWTRLGIPGFSHTGAPERGGDGDRLTRLERMAGGVNEIQKAAVLSAQQLFLLAGPHLANQEKIRREIELAADIFNVKNILQNM